MAYIIEKYITNDNLLGKCKSSITTFNIMPNGIIEPCGFAYGKLKLGNIKQFDLIKIFDDYNFEHENEICRNCKMNMYVDKKSLTYKNKIIG